MVNSEEMILRARKLREHTTDAEKKLWSKIRNRQLRYRFNRQYIVDDKYIVDFVCLEKKLTIELDGGQHCDNPSDTRRDEYLVSKGYKLLRFWNNEILSNMCGCLSRIINELDK